jgi:hypothetical protein
VSPNDVTINHVVTSIATWLFFCTIWYIQQSDVIFNDHNSLISGIVVNGGMAPQKTSRPSARKSVESARPESTGKLPPERTKLPRFGKLLKQWRIEAGYDLLKTAADRLQECGWPFQKAGQKDGRDRERVDNRPSVIAQMESGRISNPDVANLEIIAKAYRRQREDVIAALMADKYRLLPDGSNEEALREVAEVIALGARKQVAGEIGAALLRMNVLDIRGLAQWEINLTIQPAQPVELWVIAPNFVDNTNADIFKAVTTLLGAGAKITYFVRAEDLQEMANFDQLVGNLEDYAQNVDNGILKGQVHGVGLRPDQVCWMVASFAISNPGTATPSSLSHAKGFTIVASDGTPAYGIPMSERDLLSRVGEIKRFLSRNTGDSGPKIYFPSDDFKGKMENS